MAITIGKFINASLRANEALMGRVKSRVYPVVVPDWEHADAPYIWYFSESSSELSDKDGMYGYLSVVNIEVVASSYDEMIDLASMVVDAIKNYVDEWNSHNEDFHVTESTLKAGPESYNDLDQCYSRVLSFDFITES